MTFSTMRLRAVLAILTVTVGCSGLTDVPPPSNLVDPSQVASQAAALGMYKGGVFQFAYGFGGYGTDVYAASSGLFSDEYTTTAAGTTGFLDTHNGTPADFQGPYDKLQTARAELDVGINALIANGGSAPKSYIAELYALKGYVYVVLSELYCSGISFSSLQGPNQTLVYSAGLSQTEMLNTAVTLFDSADAYATDSVRIQGLVAVGRGRAYLDLGDYANAKSSVSAVQTSFHYDLTYGATSWSNYFSDVTSGNGFGVLFFIADREGQHGLDYLSSGDVRMASVDYSGYAIPAKFSTPGAPVILADGIEARLIEAEAALHDHDYPTWANTLNTLRASGGPTAIAALTADSTTGAATDSARVDVMFRERAFWMFGTGHRAGDMRRLVRQYQRRATDVYPTGVQPLMFQPILYVPVPNLPVEQAELDNNPLSKGCTNRDA